MCAILAMVALSCLSSSVVLAQNDVLTHHNDVARTGQNLNETILTPANVNAAEFGKLFQQSVDGILVGQPLYASNVLMGDGLVHNVVIVATQHDTVYAFDADSDEPPIWSVSLGTPDPIGDFGCTGVHFKEIGIMSTPVIDAAKTTIYVVAKTMTGKDERQFDLHALDLTTGAEKLGGPVTITGSYGSESFLVQYQMQRPALLLQNGSVFIGFGGNGCDIYTYNGWLFAYDSQTLEQEGVFEVSPNGVKSSFWQGGAGPAVDEFGNIYAVTANGTYDGPNGENDYGDSVLKLGWNGNSFGILDYFTPYNQDYLQDNDKDLGSAGPLILPDQPGLYPHELVAGGKGGTLYLINRDDLGQYNSGYDNVIQSFPGETSFQLTGVPSYWNGSVYVAGDHDYIKQYGLVNGYLTTTPVSQSTVQFGGKGVASTSITSNGTQGGILWALQHSTNILYAFDPTNLANEFYNSKQALHQRDKIGDMARYVTPTISNGKVYIPERTELAVFGLLPVLSPVSGNNQTGTKREVLPVPLVVSATDAYTSAPLAGITIKCNDGKANGVLMPNATQTTDASGTVTYDYELPSSPQAITISCTSLTTTTTTFSEACAPGAPADLKAVSGQRQTAPPNTMLPIPLVVKVVDASNVPVPGVTVNFTDNGAGGTLNPASGVTDSEGRVSVQYTTGPNPGKVNITASAAGLAPLIFKETVQ
jgi:Bacterial Ig-like domain (group 1)